MARARAAREAIKIMTDLVAAHGYYSSGESFSIADPKEVWRIAQRFRDCPAGYSASERIFQPRSRRHHLAVGVSPRIGANVSHLAAKRRQQI